jgi:hypothetical protein
MRLFFGWGKVRADTVLSRALKAFIFAVGADTKPRADCVYLFIGADTKTGADDVYLRSWS